MTIFIIGYMAAGKTTFGRALAKHINYDFIDLDLYIEQRYRQSIPEIFAKKGEDAFRDMEHRMLREAGEFCDTIISCGGGTPCFNSNMDFMLSHGIVVWLKADENVIARRVEQRPGKRPLLSGLSHQDLIIEIEKGLKNRTPVYSLAHISIDGSRLESRQEIQDTISAFLPQLSELSGIFCNFKEDTNF